MKDKILDKQLLDDGYVIIPFLQKEEIEKLTSFFYENHEEVPKGLYATAHNPDVDFRNKMNEEIKKVFSRANKENFDAVRALGGTFMVKSKGKEGLLYPHQDWNIVDEEEYRSFNVWVPLVNVSEKNGTIQVLEKSHQMVKSYRGINIPSAFENVYDESWAKMKSIHMKAGEALVYDHRVLHASKENCTDENRLVVVYGIIPKDAEIRYYYQENGKIAEYACSPSFFMYKNPAEGPQDLEKLKEIAYDFPSVSFEEKASNKSIFAQLKKWFS